MHMHEGSIIIILNSYIDTVLIMIHNSPHLCHFIHFRQKQVCNEVSCMCLILESPACEN